MCGLKCERYTMHAFNINIVALNVDAKLVSVLLLLAVVVLKVRFLQNLYMALVYLEGGAESD